MTLMTVNLGRCSLCKKGRRMGGRKEKVMEGGETRGREEREGLERRRKKGGSKEGGRK